MSNLLYKLRCNAVGHDKDVRSLCNGSNSKEVFVSGSRDVTGRVWTSNNNNGFSEGNILSGHSGFIAAVCVLPATEEHPDGLIATASNDKMIHIYGFDSPVPLVKLAGHTDTVCSLSLGKHGTLLSGSWDKTAKVWLKDKNLMTLAGHELAVWCVTVMPEGGYMITGSADKLIKIWKAGKCEQTLRGHDDCVRGIIPVNSAEFLSCSNDTSIRRWSLTGTVLKVYHSHMDYVYSIAMFPNSTTDFVSVGEDRSLKVWRNDDCVQTISHPATSVWSVCVLCTGDIVTGSSDGVIRVFTNSEERMASSEELKAFEEQVSATEIPTQVGDIDSSKLPGPEALFTPGKKDGAVQMVKVGTKVEAHQWSVAEQKWYKVGDVVGSSGGNSTGKTTYEGKEYDFVFSVDIAEGQPPLQLPYNMTEDPWAAAQRFITKHGVDQAFLQQVHDFIVQNSQSVSMSQQSASSSYRDPLTGGSSYVPGSSAGGSSGGVYMDPFTGGARYVPSGGTATGSNASSIPAQGADPFTGGGSYRPVEANKQPATNDYFPMSAVLPFSTVNMDAMLKKLKVLNSFLKGSQKCEEGDLDIAKDLCNADKDPTMPMLAYLWRMLQWPKEHVFPCIDTLRMALRNRVTNEHFCSDQRGPELLALLVKYVGTEYTIINQTVALRALANLPVHTAGLNLLLANCQDIIPLVVVGSKSMDKNLQIAASTVLMNLGIILKPTNQIERKSELITAMIKVEENLAHDEAKFRLCCGLGTLIWKDEECMALANSLEVMSMVRKWDGKTEEGKLEKCAKCVAECLS